MVVTIVEFPPIVEGREAEFEQWFAWSNALLEECEGLVARRLLRPLDGVGGYVGIVEHESERSLRAMHASPQRAAARAKVEQLFEGAPTPRLYEIVVDPAAARGAERQADVALARKEEQA